MRQGYFVHTESTHTFEVKTPIDSIAKMLSADKWLSFVPGYKRLIRQSRKPIWPHEGGNIIVGYALLKQIKITVCEYKLDEQGRPVCFRTHEEGGDGWMRGFFTDDVTLTFKAGNENTTILTFVNKAKYKSSILFRLVRPFIPMIRERWLWSQVQKNIKAMF